jgi:peptidoglycan/LPS O-acetylase OafA/YrhL
MPETNHRMSRILPAAVAIAYLTLVLLALLLTLNSLDTTDSSGLNNLFQVPLALPWWIIVPAPESHVADAWLTAALGGLNACIVFLAIRALMRRQVR